MPTECSAELFEFAPVERRVVVAGFDGGAITSDAGALLLVATDRAIRLVSRFADCFIDHRSPGLVEHQVATLVGQRVFGLALGYEDINDHDELRHDPVMAVLAGKLEARRQDCAPVAGKSTLNRLELSRPLPTRYHKIDHDPVAIEGLFVDLFLAAHQKPPEEIILDLDATDDPLHGHQEGRFFHGYYDCYCYLPLYIFCGRHLLAAKLRRSNIDAAAGAEEEIARIVAQIRRRWPLVRIVLRADSGFAREALMAWCEAHGVDYLFGLAKNKRLIRAIGTELAAARAASEEALKPARRFKDLTWSTRKSWSRKRRVIAKAEWTQGEANPRFVVTSLVAADGDAGYLYEEALLRARRDGEPDQGMPARPLRRSHLGHDHAGQSAAPMVRLDGLCPGRQPAPQRLAGHRAGQCHVRHHPPQALQDRRSRHHQCPPRQVRHGIRLPLQGGLRHRSSRPQRCPRTPPEPASATTPRSLAPRPRNASPRRPSHQ